MRNQVRSVLRTLAFASALTVFGIACADTRVETQEEYFDAVKTLEPGDTLVLANGEWRDFEILFEGQGTADRPITLTAETAGKVVITGRSNLRLAGEHLVVSGLVFRDGHTPTNTVIAFRRAKGHYANHSRVTEVVVDHFNNPERSETDFWVMMYGRNNRFDHNHLEGKSNSGVTMAVRLDAEENQNNHHRIDHNYFGPRQVLGSNGGETLRIGTSKYSLTDSHTVVENNFFDRCNGEVEIVSNKSGKNTFRGNVFYESRGTLTLRHGNGNLIENNAFLGNGVDHTGGIRVINKQQVIRNNYLSGLKGYRFGGAFVIMNGVPNSPINRYHQVEETLIENNTILDSDHIELAAGSDDERSAVPLTTTFRNNLIVNRDEVDSIAVHDDISGITFENNVVDGVATLPADSGFVRKDVELQEAPNGLLYAADEAIRDVGVSASFEVLPRDATGPSWYPKPDYASRFSGGKTMQVQPGTDALYQALRSAGPGDVIELQPGDYSESRILEIDIPVTFRGLVREQDRPIIRFDRTALFELRDGGSLRLEGLDIDGSSAPDAYGNAAIRTSRYSMLGNYELLVDNVRVSNLNTNHSFNFLKASRSTFADNVEIRNSQFADISGHVVALEREIDDLGIYNGEYVSITGSTFRNIDGTVAWLYRGGTDESTFGPHFTLRESTLDNVGKGKRNKTRGSVYLLGVQVANIADNTIRNSRPVRIVETVGEPITTLSDNQFIDTEEPDVGPLQEDGA